MIAPAAGHADRKRGDEANGADIRLDRVRRGERHAVALDRRLDGEPDIVEHRPARGADDGIHVSVVGGMSGTAALDVDKVMLFDVDAVAGSRHRKTGRNGKNKVGRVPPGTIVYRCSAETVQEVAEAFRGADTPVAVLCSTDALYAERSDRVPGQTTLRLVAEDGAITPIGPRGGPRRRPSKRR